MIGRPGGSNSLSSRIRPAIIAPWRPTSWITFYSGTKIRPRVPGRRRFPLTANLYVNHRAIVVLHHLGGGRAPAVTTASEAQARVQSVVRRMSSLWSGNETAGQAECEDLITSPCLEGSG